MNGWRRITEGDPEWTVLAVDFDSPARPEAGFTRFGPLLRPSRELWLTSQPDAAETELVPVERYLALWRDRPAGSRVDAVLGYCVGCVFAAAIADELATAQGSRPRLVLVDPEPVEVFSLHRDLTKAVNAMAPLSERERAEHVADSLALCTAAGEDFDAAAAGVVKLYQAAAGTAFERLGFDEDTADELMGVFRSYVSYLAAAWRLHPERDGGWTDATVLTCAAASPGAKYARERLMFPVGTEDMLGDQGVADAVHRLLAGHAA